MSAEQLIIDNIDTWTSTVKTKSAAGRGSSKKRELYGVKKLRELILELAVRGKLVPQDPMDEPASVLLERISEEKAQLVKDKKVTKPKKLPEITEQEKSEELPNGWQWCRFGDLYNLEYGDNLPKAKRSESGDYPVYGSNGIVGTHSDFSVGEACVVVGRKGSAGALNKSKTPCWVTDVAYSITPPTGLLLDYCFLHLSTFGLGSLGKGIKPGLNRNEANILIASLPPTEEQHRIVAKVDELMTLCDQLEQQTEASIEAHQLLVTTLLDTLTNSADADELMQNWARISEHFDTLFTTEASIDQLKQTILQLAVMGKLVPQDPNDELQPNNLVTVVKEQRAISSLAKNTGKVDLNTFEFFSEKLTLPSNWTVHPLAEVVLAVVDCPHSTPKWTDSGEICVRTTQMAPFSLDLSTSRYVSSDTYLKRIERLKPESDDVLYSREGGILGVACRVPSGVELCLGQRMIVIRPSRLITSRFLELVLNSPLVNEIARHTTTGGAAPRVNVNVIKGYPIPLPPIDEQNRVITKVEKLIDLCDLLKARLKDSQTTQLHLTDAIVEQAV